MNRSIGIALRVLVTALSIGAVPLASPAQETVPATAAPAIHVRVLGAVRRPGSVELAEGDRLSLAVARAGADAVGHPDLGRIYLTRPGAGGSYQIDLFRALREGDRRSDPVLHDGDMIFVPETAVPPALKPKTVS